METLDGGRAAAEIKAPQIALTIAAIHQLDVALGIVDHGDAAHTVATGVTAVGGPGRADRNRGHVAGGDIEDKQCGLVAFAFIAVADHIDPFRVTTLRVLDPADNPAVQDVPEILAILRRDVPLHVVRGNAGLAGDVNCKDRRTTVGPPCPGGADHHRAPCFAVMPVAGRHRTIDIVVVLIDRVQQICQRRIDTAWHICKALNAGGGIKGGLTYGATDDFGYHAVENRVHVRDLHATMLHLMGIDHTRLTYRFSGRDMRLTDVHGHVIRDVLG